MLCRPKEQILDGKSLFYEYFIIMGSARSLLKLQRRLKKDGVVNPDTGRIVNVAAIESSIWTWAMRNDKKAYEIYNQAAFNEGKFFSEDDFEKKLQQHAWRITKAKFDDRRFRGWLEARGKKKVEWQKANRNENLTSI